MFIRPAPGLKVRNPATLMHIPATGVEVPDTDTYWARRLGDGDVVLATAPAPLTAEPQPTPMPSDKE